MVSSSSKSNHKESRILNPRVAVTTLAIVYWSRVCYFLLYPGVDVPGLDSTSSLGVACTRSLLLTMVFFAVMLSAEFGDNGNTNSSNPDTSRKILLLGVACNAAFKLAGSTLLIKQSQADEGKSLWMSLSVVLEAVALFSALFWFGERPKMNVLFQSLTSPKMYSAKSVLIYGGLQRLIMGGYLKLRFLRGILDSETPREFNSQVAVNNMSDDASVAVVLLSLASLASVSAEIKAAKLVLGLHVVDLLFLQPELLAHQGMTCGFNPLCLLRLITTLGLVVHGMCSLYPTQTTIQHACFWLAGAGTAFLGQVGLYGDLVTVDSVFAAPKGCSGDGLRVIGMACWVASVGLCALSVSVPAMKLAETCYSLWYVGFTLSSMVTNGTFPCAGLACLPFRDLVGDLLAVLSLCAFLYCVLHSQTVGTKLYSCLPPFLLHAVHGAKKISPGRSTNRPRSSSSSSGNFLTRMFHVSQ